MTEGQLTFFKVRLSLFSWPGSSLSNHNDYCGDGGGGSDDENDPDDPGGTIGLGFSRSLTSVTGLKEKVYRNVTVVTRVRFVLTGTLLLRSTRDLVPPKSYGSFRDDDVLLKGERDGRETCHGLLRRRKTRKDQKDILCLCRIFPTSMGLY